MNTSMACPRCGAWFGEGTPHTCYVPVAFPPTATVTWPPTPTPWIDNAALHRIAAALERVADALAEKP